MESLFVVDQYQFEYICEIKPDTLNGKVKPYLPQGGYQNADGISLHQYGAGPFCHFAIPKFADEGVYLIRVNDVIRYVGECENLSNRFNMGYGNVSPRNCFVGGQPTNCRINNNIYEMARNQCEIVLFFHRTNDRFEVERQLIEKLNPEWNVSRGKYRPSIQRTGDSSKKDIGTMERITSEPLIQANNVRKSKHSTCRDEVLSAVRTIVKSKGMNRFTVAEVVDYMVARHSSYQESTIRTHVVSKCCVNAPTHHATVYNDFERVEHGVYKLLRVEM